MLLRRLATTALVVVCLAASSASAQSDADNRAMARAFFDEGLAFGEEERWDEAVDRFRRAYELLQSAAIAVNLASALIPTGALVEASELLRGLLEDEGTPRNVRRLAESLLNDEVLPSIGRLTIRLEGSYGDVIITRNGIVVPEVAMGMELPADPGETIVAALRDEREVASTTIVVEPGDSAEVTLNIPEGAPSPAEVARRAEDTDDSTETGESSTAVTGQWWFWTGIVGAVAVGVLVAVLAGGGEDPATAIGGNTDPPFLEGEVMP